MKNLKGKLDFLETMLKIRGFEQKIEELFSKGLLGGTCHLCIGQEASAVGIISQLKKGDKVISSHRGHGHAIAIGCDLSRLFGELLGKEIGYCKGRGGTQHICASEKGFYGTNGITGGGIPIATGLALAAKRDKKKQVIVSMFGDGAINQGTFHESLNMAAIWNLPIIYVCENNLYAMSMHIDKAVKIKELHKRSESYGIHGEVVDGTDVEAIAKIAKKAIERARKNKGPTLLETKSYRYKGHSKSDNRVYRTRREENEWLKKDCISKFETILKQQGQKDKIIKIKSSLEKEINKSFETANQSKFAEDYYSGVR